MLAHYHQRSHVESTVALVKSKFRDRVRSQTDTAMPNEMLCQFLCHNRVVHQAHVELGLETVFGSAQSAATTPVLLPVARPG